MHRTALLFGLICFILVAAGSYFGAIRAVGHFQHITEERLEKAIFLSGEEWVNVRANGLRLHLTGLAPDEAARFKVLESVGKFVDPNRIRDNITILEAANLAPPKFSLEALRNEERVSLIGLIPTKTGRGKILEDVEDIAGRIEVTDMLEEADHPLPETWNNALEYGLSSLALLQRAKISVTEDVVVVSAVTESQEERTKVENHLLEEQPEGVRLEMNISAPRPVISPFTIRFELEEGVATLDGCSADTQITKQKIIRAAKAAGMVRPALCNIGLGVPTPDWARAIELSIKAVSDLGGGTLTFTDSDVSLISSQDTPQQKFDTVIGKLENSLPELFSLSAFLPPKPVIDGQTGELIVPDFTATRSPEGSIQLRGRLPSVVAKTAIETYAKSLFGHDAVYVQTRLDENLPDGWPIRVLGGLEALAQLHHGILVVRPEDIEVRGIADMDSAAGDISRILAVRVGAHEVFNIKVEIDEKLAKKNRPVTPESCEADINSILTDYKIQFNPGKVEIEGGSKSVVTAIADVLRSCPKVKFEIQGHTDSSGSEELNQNLSQSRAEAVLSALLTRRVLTSGLKAKGYGSANPIADNGTEAGREANRRIVFKLASTTTANTPTTDKPADQGSQTMNADDIKRKPNP
jgi:OOP family OmpA-OmpF porin